MGAQAVQPPFSCTLASPSFEQNVASNEIDEGWRKSHEQRHFAEDDCNGTGAQVENVLSGVQHFREHRQQGGEEDGRVRYSRFVPNQDPNKAGHQSGSEGHLWQGDEGQGQASEDCCEGVSRSCVEEADLKQRFVVTCLLRGFLAVGIPRSGLEMSTYDGPGCSNLCTFIMSAQEKKSHIILCTASSGLPNR